MRLLVVLGPCCLDSLRLILVMQVLLRRYLKVCHDGYLFYSSAACDQHFA